MDPLDRRPVDPLPLSHCPAPDCPDPPPSLSGNLSSVTVASWQARLPWPAYGWVTMRPGGASRPPWDSLNLAYHVHDDPDAVGLNRSRVRAALALPSRRWITAEQVHGQAIAWIGQRPPQAAGAELAAVQGVDGLISPLVDQPMALFFADCVPILLAAPGLIGVAHAGWRGSWLGIARQMVQSLVSASGSLRPQDIWVSLGPAIGPCCYTVSPPLWEAFRRRWGQTAAPHPYALDLKAVNRWWLRQSGVPDDHIEVCSDCTACQVGWYFSHRRDGFPTGRMAAVVVRRSTAWQGSPTRVPNPPQG